MEPVVIVSTGVANTASVSAAIRRCGFDVVLTDDAAQVRDAERVVLPGVGSFAAGMALLRDRGLDCAIRDRTDNDRPLLAICLGMQLLCSRSEESPGIEGINAIDADVRRLPAGVRVPQFGWNRIEAARSLGAASGYAYYANSYCIVDPPTGWSVSTTRHGVDFAAMLERGSTLACQFHPELSGAWGAGLISTWLACKEVKSTC